MKYKVEFSQIVRRKMKDLKLYLTEQFGAATAAKSLELILEAAKSLADFPLKGASLAALFDISLCEAQLSVLLHRRRKNHNIRNV